MNQRKNKVNNEMGATETEKATQGAATSSAGTVRKVTPPTLAQQWEELAQELENEAVEMGEADPAFVAVEIRRGVRDDLDLARLAGAAARVGSLNFDFVVGFELKAGASLRPDAIETALQQTNTALYLMHETACAVQKPTTTPAAAPSAAAPRVRRESNVEMLLHCVDRLTSLDCTELDTWRAKPLRSAMVAAAHCLTTEREIGIGHGSHRAGLIALSRHVARVFGRQATRFEGANDKERGEVAEELLTLAEILSEIALRVRDAQAQVAEVSK